MSSLMKKIDDLNGLVLQGRSLEAFEIYYHDNVIMQENENPPTIGKEANRRRENEFYSSITGFRSAQPVKVTFGETSVWYSGNTIIRTKIGAFVITHRYRYRSGKMVKL